MSGEFVITPRRFSRRPGFTRRSIAVPAIGVAAAMFSIAGGARLRPLPCPERRGSG